MSLSQRDGGRQLQLSFFCESSSWETGRRGRRMNISLLAKRGKPEDGGGDSGGGGKKYWEKGGLQ